MPRSRFSLLSAPPLPSRGIVSYSRFRSTGCSPEAGTRIVCRFTAAIRCVNHALLWLLQQRDAKTRTAVDIPRVRQLRDTSTGFARREAQLALDGFGTEEWEAIKRARQRMKGSV